MSYRHNSLRCFVGACLLVGEDVLGGTLLPFVWLGMGEDEGEAGLMSGILFVFSVLKARSSVWRVFLFSN